MFEYNGVVKPADEDAELTVPNGVVNVRVVRWWWVDRVARTTSRASKPSSMAGPGSPSETRARPSSSSAC